MFALRSDSEQICVPCSCHNRDNLGHWDEGVNLVKLDSYFNPKSKGKITQLYFTVIIYIYIYICVCVIYF